jgi:hypothetical protein
MSENQKTLANNTFTKLVKRGSLAICISCTEMTRKLTVLAAVSGSHKMLFGGVKQFSTNGRKTTVFVFQHAIFCVTDSVVHYCWL